jgi:hypothetical protein
MGLVALVDGDLRSVAHCGITRPHDVDDLGLLCRIVRGVVPRRHPVLEDAAVRGMARDRLGDRAGRAQLELGDGQLIGRVAEHDVHGVLGAGGLDRALAFDGLHL